MKLIKEGIAKEIPEKLVADHKAKGWKELKPAKPAKTADAKGKKEA